MTNSTILAIDQGTTSSRAILFSARGNMLGCVQKELTQHYPRKGWVEHDPEEIWQDTLAAVKEILQTIPEAKSCAAIGIANQRETTIIWDRKTGKPVYNAIVWQDKRTADICQSLRTPVMEKMVAQKTGLLIDPYFSCTKIAWLLDHVKGCRERAENGELAFGTIDSFLLFRLTGGQQHATDATNASRTGLFNIITQQWDDELLALYNIPKSLFPVVKDNVADFGVTNAFVVGAEIPIGGMAGDQHAALIGQCCFKPGMMKATYGTGCFTLMNIGHDFKLSQNKLLTTIAYRLDGRVTYAVEGSIFIAGAVIQWLRDNMGLIAKSSDSEAIALSVSDSNGVYFVPAFSGLGAPHWIADAHGMIFGLTRDTMKAHIIRAALEAQAYQSYDLLRAMKRDTGLFPEELRIDGGLAANKFVCQFLADILQTKVDQISTIETTALGTAYLAGLYAGLYSDIDAISQNWFSSLSYTPRMNVPERDTLYDGWANALSCLLHK